MIKTIILITLVYLLYKIYATENYFNYNLNRNFKNYFQDVVLTRQTPFSPVSTYWNAGRWQIPKYSTNHGFGQIYSHHYAWHHYLTSDQISGYQNRVSLISTPPLAHASRLPLTDNY